MVISEVGVLLFHQPGHSTARDDDERQERSQSGGGVSNKAWLSQSETCLFCH